MPKVIFDFETEQMAEAFISWFIHTTDHNDPLEDFLDYLEYNVAEEIFTLENTKDKVFKFTRMNSEVSS